MVFTDENPPPNKSDGNDAVNPNQAASELLALLDLFKRDPMQWVNALLRYWIIIVAVPIVVMLAVYGYRAVTVPKIYRSSAALVRQELPDLRNSGLPAGYSPTQLSVVFNMIRSRTCLEETLRRLNLNWSHEQLFQCITVTQAERNSNYFFIQAATSDPKLSAKIVNTLSQVFIDHYKEFIRSNLNSIYESSDRNRRMLEKELEALQQRLKKLSEEKGIVSLTLELASLSRRIQEDEIHLQSENITLQGLRSQLDDLERQIQSVTPEVVLYKETSTARDQALTAMKLELAELRQQYTDDNPIVINKQQVILAMEEELSRQQDDGLSKVVTGKNPEYTNLSAAITRAKAEITAGLSRQKEFREGIARLKDRQEELNLLAPEFNMIEEQISQKKQLLRQQERIGKELEMFLERSYSDISLAEEAIPPNQALPRRLMLFALISGVVAGFVLVGLALLKETVNLTVRSRTDLVKALQLKSLGVIPLLQPECRADFYSALQGVVVNASSEVKSCDIPVLFAVFPSENPTKYAPVFAELMNIISIRDLRCLRIIDIPENETPSKPGLLINDFLYHLSDRLPDPGKADTLWFKLDDMAFLSLPPADRLRQVCSEAAGYDVVIWELFENSRHSQLFTAICNTADATVIPMEYAVSSKWRIFQLLKQLRDNGVKRIFGVLLGVDKKNYRRVS